MEEKLDRHREEATGSRALTRRKLLESAAVAGASAALFATTGGGTAMAESTTGPLAPAYRGEHTIEPLPFDPKNLRGLSEKLIVSHHANNYAGAVNRLNGIERQLGALPRDAAPFQFGSLKREELIASNSMRLHELYFANLGGDGRAEGRAARLLKDAYGSLEAWEHDFRQTALSLGGGSGWVVVAWDRKSGALRNRWAWDHAHQSIGGEPVLVLDLYEHAYHMDYGAATKAYVDAFFANVRWEELERRVERLHPIGSAPRSASETNDDSA